MRNEIHLSKNGSHPMPQGKRQRNAIGSFFWKKGHHKGGRYIEMGTKLGDGTRFTNGEARTHPVGIPSCIGNTNFDQAINFYRKAHRMAVLKEVMMPIDPYDFLKISNTQLDPLRVSEALRSAINISHTDPAAGLGAAINTSMAIRDTLYPSSTLFSSNAFKAIEKASSLASLGALRTPFDELSAFGIVDGYRGTISSLASVAGVAESMQLAYPSHSIANSIGSLTPSMSVSPFSTGVADAFSSTRSIASSYLSSAASVYAVESTMARAISEIADSEALFASTILLGTSLGNLNCLHNTVSSLSLAAQSVWGGMDRNPLLLALATPAILRLPAVELYASAHAAASVSLQKEALPTKDDEVEEIINETVDTIETRLASLDHNLVEVYRGGIAAIDMGGPDWQRHSMTSFREISMHILHKLAPDKEVIAKGCDLHNGRPTRHARLSFIFSDMAGGELTGFFEADMKAALELFDLLNGGTHRLGNKATPEQVYYLKGRLTGLISSMLAARGY